MIAVGTSREETQRSGRPEEEDMTPVRRVGSVAQCSIKRKWARGAAPHHTQEIFDVAEDGIAD